MLTEAAESSGLTTAEAARRRAEFGPNAIQEQKRARPIAMFLRQFRDSVILMLLAAAVISAIVSDVQDATLIIVIVLLNAALGFLQEYRADHSLQALKSLAPTTAAVARDGKRSQIPVADIVPGDVIFLEAGQIVPADLRLFEAAGLRADESMLTGESVPADKTAEPADSEPSNLLFKGSIVTAGRGAGVAHATGMSTEFGKIAALLEGAGTETTPLQRRLAAFSRRLALAVLVICAIVFIAGLARGEPALLMFLTAVSLAVAAIPEALPAVVAITLALGARKMAHKKALVQKLPAVETLGSVTYICADKTGTLTANEMRVEEAYAAGEWTRSLHNHGPGKHLMLAMALNNDVRPGDTGQAIGDPTEKALYAAVEEAGGSCERTRLQHPRIGEIPFDSHRMLMTTIHRTPDDGFISYTKGAPEVVFERSISFAAPNGERPFASVESELRSAAREMAAKGLRVLALAMREWPDGPPASPYESVEQDLVLLGIVGLIDPPRAGVRVAVEVCKAAGVTPVMITGDHPITAEALARRLGILEADDQILTGSALAALSPGELDREAARTRVYARVAPEQKLQIVRALQAKGEIVAMTGDGVNDSPALKQADIGVAMGMAGTDVAKEASAMVLLDDNFATIVTAVGEGRRIYDNIRRFVKYALTTNSAEIWVIFLAPFLGMPIPLLPVQILWTNLMTDGLPGLALAAEPAERNVMRRPPRAPQESVFAGGLGFHAVWVGLFMAATALVLEAFFWNKAPDHWRTMVFTALCLSQLGHALAIRSERASLFQLGLFSNASLAAAVAFTCAAQLIAIYSPVLNRLLKTERLTLGELAITFAVASLVFLAVEAEKWWKRRF